jgi:hypothetical protein
MRPSGVRARIFSLGFLVGRHGFEDIGHDRAAPDPSRTSGEDCDLVFELHDEPRSHR